MRIVELNSEEFDKIFYRSLTSIPSADENELEISVRIKQIMKEISTPMTLSPEEVLAGTIPNRELVEDSCRMIFEEDEFALVCKKVKAAIPSFTGYVDELLHSTWMAVKNAEKYVAVVPEEAATILEDITPDEAVGG